MGVFPDEWKEAVVTPIFKSDDPQYYGDYRPISVLSIIAKIFESLISQQLFEFLDNNENLTKYQSGFRKGHSTMTPLLNSTNQWLLNTDKGLINGILFLDLRKAFDTIDHTILLEKLQFYLLHSQLWRTL